MQISTLHVAFTCVLDCQFILENNVNFLPRYRVNPHGRLSHFGWIRFNIKNHYAVPYVDSCGYLLSILIPIDHML